MQDDLGSSSRPKIKATKGASVQVLGCYCPRLPKSTEHGSLLTKAGLQGTMAGSINSAYPFVAHGSSGLQCPSLQKLPQRQKPSWEHRTASPAGVVEMQVWIFRGERGLPWDFPITDHSLPDTHCVFQYHFNPSQSILVMEGDDIGNINRALQKVSYINSRQFPTAGVRRLRVSSEVQ